MPELVHLPAIILLALVVATGVSFPASILFAIKTFQSTSDRPTAIAALVAALGVNLVTLFCFRCARNASASAFFLGLGSKIWLIAISLGYLTGFGFGIYLWFLFYF
ncbi:MAG: hypothetical protein ABJC04_08735 [Verrucomicrobiota bacterium]